jgi:hypothetical protein
LVGVEEDAADAGTDCTGGAAAIGALADEDLGLAEVFGFALGLVSLEASMARGSCWATIAAAPNLHYS